VKILLLIEKTVLFGLLLGLMTAVRADGLPSPDEVTLDVIQKDQPAQVFVQENEMPEEPGIRVSFNSTPTPEPKPEIIAPPPPPEPPATSPYCPRRPVN